MWRVRLMRRPVPGVGRVSGHRAYASLAILSSGASLSEPPVGPDPLSRQADAL